jgi:phage-related protein
VGNLGPTVTLTFAGDSTSLDKTTSKVGSSVTGLSDTVGKSTREIGEASEGMRGKLTEAADGSEQKLIGLHDVVDGLSGTFQGFKDGSVTEVAQGLADMAGGIAAFVIPVIGSLGSWFKTAAVAVKGFSLTLLSSPITWIVLGIAAIVAAIVLMVTHWNTVKRVVGDVGSFIKRIWGDVWGFLSGIFAKIGHAVGAVWDGLGNGLKAALNGVIWVLNRGIDGINFLIRGIDWLPGVNIGQIPHIPKLHTGGVVPGTAGSEMLTILQAGERVIPATGGQAAAGGTATVKVLPGADQAVATMIMQLVRSGKLQLVAA